MHRRVADRHLQKLREYDLGNHIHLVLKLVVKLRPYDLSLSFEGRPAVPLD